MESPRVLKLSDISKFAVALNSPSARGRTSALGGTRTSAHAELTKRLRAAAFSASGSLARENAAELSAIRAVDDLDIDFRQALAITRGDLSILQSTTYRCFPRAPHLADIPLLLQRIECMDRRIYDLKVYEADTFLRFQAHPNVLALYSYWSEPPSSAYTYKTLVFLTEECVGGTLADKVRPQSPTLSYRQSLVWAADLCKALLAFHNCNLIHANVKLQTALLDARNTLRLGMPGRVELDAHRQTHQLFSKLLIQAAIPAELIYWAPELLQMQAYDTAADMWAAGVVLYFLLARTWPFRTDAEDAFKEDVLSAAVDLDVLAPYPRIQVLVDNLLLVDPRQRWTAHEALYYVQEHFAVELQRIYKGYLARRAYKSNRGSLVKIQSVVRMFLARRRYVTRRANARHDAALTIQRNWRKFGARSSYVETRSWVMKLQARVLARQCRDSFCQYRSCIIRAQSVARRYIAQRWYDRVREGRAVLEAKLRTLDALCHKYAHEANEYAHLFTPARLPLSLSHVASIESWNLQQYQDNQINHRGQGQHGLATYLSTVDELMAAKQRMAEMEANMAGLLLAQREREMEDARMRDELGEKYAEYAPMVDALRRNLRRVQQQCMRAEPLPLGIAHPYTYSKWDSVHEPHNVVENVLVDDDRVYRTVGPVVDITLCRSLVCFVAYVTVEFGDPVGLHVEVYIGDVPDKYTLVSTHRNDDKLEKLRVLLPGETMGRYLRIVCKNNTRGGNIVAVRRVVVEGLVKDE